MDELELKKAEVVAVPVETPAPAKRNRKPAVKAAPEVQESAPVIPDALSLKEQQRRASKEKWMKERDRKAKLVTGKFLFNECPGGELIFYFREFPGDQNVKYTMRHDQIYTVPLGVAMHLNDNCSYPEYQHNLDNGKAVDVKNMYIMSKIHRTNFIPMDWSIDVGNSSGKSIAQVTYANPQDTRYNLDSQGRNTQF